MSKDCKIEIQPTSDLIDAALGVRVIGLQAGQKITIRSSAEDDDKKQWQAFGVFKADDNGVVDLEKQPPVSGTFTVADPKALLWSMRPGGSLKAPVPAFEKADALTPIEVSVTVEDEGKIIAQSGFKRQFIGEGVKISREPVEMEGVIGTLFYPATGGPHPAVICLSGSGGGISEPRAALLASRGYAAFGLAYFGVKPLRDELVEVPLDFFDKAVEWLANHKAVDSNRIAVWGYSKGAELALLLASRYPQIKAVAAFSPSSVVWAGFSPPPPRSSWTYKGQPLPFLPMKFSLSTVIKFMLKRPIAFLSAYEKGLENSKAAEAAAIPVEKINGPVLLVSGTGDQVWPAAKMSEMVIDRLKQKNHPHHYEHICYDDGGHVASVVGLPGSMRFRNLIASSNFEQNCLANIKAWKTMLDFFKKYLL